MTLFHGNAIPSATGYDIDNSLRFNNSGYLSRTPSSAGNRKTWTLSMWVKRGLIKSSHMLTAYTSSSNTTNIAFDFGSLESLQWYDYISGYRIQLSCTQNFNDVAGWYHLMFVLDTTQSTAANRAKIYVNGEQVTAFDEETYPSQNADLKMNTTIEHRFGDTAQFSREYDGYMAEVHFIDGTALTPSSFGETDEDYGHWKPKKVSGLTYGTNGFYLDFGNSGSLGNDANGSNNWTTNNNAAHDQTTDSPTNNFCTFNPLAMSVNNTMSEGNLQWMWSSSGNYHTHGKGTFSVDSGKWYWEVYKLSSRTDSEAIGIASDQTSPWRDGRQITGAQETNGVYAYSTEGKKWKDGSDGGSYGSSWSANDIIGVALDLDNGTITFYKNGSSQGTAYSDLSSSSYGGWSPAVSGYGQSGPTEFIANFGQDGIFAGVVSTAGGNSDGNGYGNFKYTVPSGFLALCSKNLPSPTVKPQDYFNTVLYTGNGSGQSITGVGFQPDWIWIKARNTSSYNPEVYDSVRGVHNSIATAAPGVEYSSNTTVTAFNSDGWSMGNNHAGINNNGTTFVAWNWKAGGTASSNTDGTITSTVSANTTAGFSIVKWAGDSSVSATVGHGLGSQLSMIICKERNGSDWWHVWSAGLSGNSYNTFLNNDNAQRASISDGHVEKLNNTTTFGFETTSNVNAVNQSGINNIAYCFAAKDGYSKMGRYEGNDLTDGHFVYTGFRPAFIMVKRIDTAGTGWIMMDNVRDTYNVMNNNLRADTSDAENTARATMPVDFLSNGFKWRINYSDVNGSSGGTYHTYAYYAVAEQSFKHSNAR